MAHKTIVLLGDPHRFEADAEEEIYPGYLLQLSTTAGDIKKHASAGQNAPAMFAIENSLEGQEIGDAYATSDKVQYVHARPGDEILACLKDGESVSINDPLESDGAGHLQKHEASSAGAVEYPNCIVGIALQALNLTSSAAGDVLSERRIMIRIV